MMNSTEEPAVRKGSVLLTRMESITAYKNQHGQNGPGKLFMTFKLSDISYNAENPGMS
jgi:hypothetical protein